MRRRFGKAIAVGAVVAAVGLAASACGSSGSDSAGSSGSNKADSIEQALGLVRLLDRVPAAPQLGGGVAGGGVLGQDDRDDVAHG